MPNNLKPCPICGKPVVVNGGSEEWIPTFYDPDSGGEPYSISCECGVSFCAGYCDYLEFKAAWNIRSANMGHKDVGYDLYGL